MVTRQKTTTKKKLESDLLSESQTSHESQKDKETELKKPKILFMGTPEFCLPTLKALKESNKLDLNMVISQPDSPSGRKMKLTPSAVKKYAMDNEIPVETPLKVSDPEYVKYLSSKNFDLVVVLAYGQLLKQSLLDIVPNKFINIHGSLLPRWRGAAPVQRALMAGDEKSGVSFQLMRLKLDSGPVIFEKEIPLDLAMTSFNLQQELSKLAAQNIEEVILKHLAGELELKEQDESLVTYAHKIKKEESELDLNNEALTLHNRVRGLLWGPGAYVYVGKKRLKLFETEVDLNEEAPVGSYFKSSDGKIWIGTGRGLLGVGSVQLEGRPKVPAKDFINGYGLTLGFSFLKS